MLPVLGRTVGVQLGNRPRLLLRLGLGLGLGVLEEDGRGGEQLALSLFVLRLLVEVGVPLRLFGLVVFGVLP